MVCHLKVTIDSLSGKQFPSYFLHHGGNLQLTKAMVDCTKPNAKRRMTGEF